MNPKPGRARVAAVLGPTNTGKTWYAIDRMLGHRTGMIGLPLRLLAREVYDRVCAARGSISVALVTGEERIIPKQARYWVCTVEAMPKANGADFLAVDEIQLCGDPERGHVFTQRLLSARGQVETVFLGSDTMRSAMAELVPDMVFQRRGRLSELTYTGAKKISRIKPRSAIVGFSVEDVYAIAEAVRQRKGGAAVVLGALSPRTRNAQVELYQNGDVEVLVATDAIGMGLNLDIDHVAFAGLAKFDGRRVRPLWPHEIGQIAGRAGRFRSHGTFGVTGEAKPLDPNVAASVENSRFQPLRRLQWRNDDLSFRTVDSLLETLQAPSENPLLVRARDADDLLALRTMAEHGGIRGRLRSPADIRLLWDVCQIPDFRKVSLHDHCELLKTVFAFLQEFGQIPDDWLEGQVRRIDRVDGDVESLSRRIAFVRTWTYLSQKSDWLADSHFWRQRTRTVEDRISDALHDGLTRRFVDRRISVLMRQMKRKEGLLADVDEQGKLTVEGENVGRIEGFRFILDDTATDDEAKTLRQASAKALSHELSMRARRFYNAPDNEIGLTDQGGFMWGEYAVGRLAAGKGRYDPDIEVFVDEEAGPEAIQQVEKRLKAYISQKISTHCAALLQLNSDETITGLARGVAYRIYESFGVVPRTRIADDVKALPQESRKFLRAHGVRFGQHAIFVFSMLKPESTRIRLLLWALSEGIQDIPAAPTPGLVTIPSDGSLSDEYYSVTGYFRAGGSAVRIDMLDRLSNMLREMDGRAGFEATTEMLSITGLSHDGFADLLAGLGYGVKRGERAKQCPPAGADGAGPGSPPSGAPVSDAAEKPAEAAGSDTGSPPGEEPETEEFYTFYWRPKPRRRPNLKTPDLTVSALAGTKPGKAKGVSKKQRGAKQRDAKPKDTRSRAKKRDEGKREPRPDPDNPFAVLAELKDRISP